MTDLVRSEAEFLLYQTEDGRTRVEVRFDGDTAWLSLSQRAELFQRDKSVISRHIKNASTRASWAGRQPLQNLQWFNVRASARSSARSSNSTST